MSLVDSLIEVRLGEQDDFLKVKETLTRVGVASGRRNTIAKLLEEWGLVKIVDDKKVAEPRLPLNQVKILPFKEKDQWTLVSKYNIGRKK